MSTDAFHPYIAAHAFPSGPGDSRTTALQILADNGLLHSNAWTGRTILLTGGTSGIGVETVRALHATGADVFFTARDERKARDTVEEIWRGADDKGKGRLEFLMMDMESLDSVKKAAAEFLERSGGKVNVLVNNAGIMASPQSQTKDGFELQFGVNHLAHFTLTVLLLPALKASSAPAFNSRVINVSSSSHRYSSIDFDDINLTNKYDPFVAYGQSKTANIWTANYIDRVYGAKGVHALSIHPGGIWSGLQKHVDADQVKTWQADKEVEKNMKSPEQGAATTVWAAVAKVWEGKGGKYLSDCGVAEPAVDMTSALDSGYGPEAYNPEGEETLWKISCQMVGLEGPELSSSP